MAAPKKTKPSPSPKSGPPARKPKNADLVPEGRRPCPICGQHMQTFRRERQVIDVCKGHGIWLDQWELESLLAARASRTRRLHDREIDRANRSGLAGLFPFLFDD